MSVRPIAFHPDGTVDLYHDDVDHGGTVALADCPLIPGTDDVPVYVAVACPAPGCGALSLWPPSGGAAPAMGQRLFALRLGPDWTAGKAALYAHLEATGQAQAWQLAAVDAPDEVEA